ncbi:MAG: IS1634 family transposase [Candidatus Hydrothermarchaeales archaeon]
MHLHKKRIKGKTYWYAREVARVRGRVKVVRQIYLGSADNIVHRIQETDPTRELSLKSYDYGLIAALLWADCQLGLSTSIAKRAEKREQGLDVGVASLLLMLGRVHGKPSRSKVSRWFKGSVLRFFYEPEIKPYPEALLRSMDYLTPELQAGVEDDIASRLGGMGFKPRLLFFDETNIFTHIQKRGELPRPGNSKDGKGEKPLIGVALACTPEYFPVFHDTYPGNRHDSTELRQVLEDLVARIESLDGAEDITLVMDKGNNSKKGIKGLRGRIGLVGSLKHNQAKWLVEKPEGEYRHVHTTARKHRVMALRSEGYRYHGSEWTLVCSFNEATRKKALKRHSELKEEAERYLKRLMERVTVPPRRGRRPTPDSVKKRAREDIHRDVRGIYGIKAVENERGGIDLSWRIDEESEAWRLATLGKTLVFTDRHEWSTGEIVQAYSGKYVVEGDFRVLKDKVLVPLKPVNVRKDGRIQGHVFLCVMALLLFRYAAWHVRELGLGFETLMEELKGIRLAIVTRKRERKARFVVEEMTPTQTKLFSLFEMEKDLPQES